MTSRHTFVFDVPVAIFVKFVAHLVCFLLGHAVTAVHHDVLEILTRDVALVVRIEHCV